jgi:hypothetical protein
VCAFTPHRLGYDVWYNDKHVGDIAQSRSGWYFTTGSYLQSNTDVRQCTAVLAGVLIRHRVPITDTQGRPDGGRHQPAGPPSSNTWQITPVAGSTGVLVHGVRSKAFRDGLENAATWLSSAAHGRSTPRQGATERQRALQQL